MVERCSGATDGNGRSTSAVHTPDHDDHDDGRSHHHDDGGPAIHYHLNNLDDFTADDIDVHDPPDDLVAAVFDVSPCHVDNCRDDRPTVHVDRTADQQRARDVAVIRATIRSANVYDGRPRRVPVTVDDILATIPDAPRDRE